MQRIDASLPGYAMEALVEANLCPNPFMGTHERDVQWVETLPWVLSTHVDGPLCQDLGDSAVLHLEGLDTYASVVVNGVHVLAANNAHRSWTTLPFEVTNHGLDIDIQFDPVAARGQD